LADDLRRFLEGKPIRQRPPAPWEPALKWATRRPAAAAWIVLGLVAFLGLSAGGLYYLEHRQEWARQDAFDRYERFLKHRDEALFQGTLLTAVGMDSREQASVDSQATRETAREALKLASVSLEGEAEWVPAANLTPLEQSNLAASCCELLLILARATGQPLPDTTPQEQREQAAEGLRILDRASRFGSPTRAFYLSQARLLALHGDSSASDAARKRAEALQPVSASDYYLTGFDQYQGGDSTQALHSFREALRLQPNHFEAQCFLAICALNAGRPGEARIGLTACIGQRPQFAWSYLLRGVAAVQEQAYAEAEADFSAAQHLDGSELVRFAVQANPSRRRGPPGPRLDRRRAPGPPGGGAAPRPGMPHSPRLPRGMVDRRGVGVAGDDARRRGCRPDRPQRGGRARQAATGRGCGRKRQKWRVDANPVMTGFLTAAPTWAALPGRYGGSAC
jgi:tetratricopeptide (TPR) repeat protein